MDTDTGHKKTSWAWKHFTDKGDYTATCNYCSKDFKYKASVSNLSKHIFRKHRTVCEADDDVTDCSDDESNSNRKIIRKKEPIPTNSTWQYFDVPDSDKFVAKCKICENEVPYESTSDLKEHVKEHNALVSSDEEWLPEEPRIVEKKLKVKLKNNKSSPVWKFMKVLNEEMKIAQCLICCTQLCYIGSTSNLRKHLKRSHPNISIDEYSKDKKVMISAGGQLYEIASSDTEKEPLKTDIIYLEDDAFDVVDYAEEIEAKSPPKKLKKCKIKESPRRITKDLFHESINTDNDVNISRTTNLIPNNNISKHDSIDLFGQYVTSLLKELPKHVSDQLQNDIIRQIFTAKLALDTQYSVTVNDKPVTVTINNSNNMPEITVHNPTTNGN